MDPACETAPPDVLTRLLHVLEALEERLGTLDVIASRFEAGPPPPQGVADLYPVDKPIKGYAEIARFVAKITNSSFGEMTARRKASGKAPGPRLPVWRFDGSPEVFALPSHLVAWARLGLVPVGAKMPGAREKRRAAPAET